MKFRKTVISALLALAAQPCSAIPTKILFIGNSYTSVNNLPEMVSAIAKSLGQEIAAEMQAPGGYTWEQHYTDKDTLAKISGKSWDFIVLQEQSQRPAWPQHQLDAMVLPYAVKLNKKIRDKTLAAQTVFYETWGHRNGDKDNCKNIPETCTYEGMQERIITTYEQAAHQTSALLAPVGKAWSKIRQNNPDIELYSEDGKHPSKEGSYLAACVLYSAIFRRGVFGADRLGLPAEQAAILQRAAQDSVFHPDTAAKDKTGL